jgi:DNA-binding NtrC family response regulator
VFSEGVLESELFGHVKGSFTDARHDHRGRFELADGGTLFLDEIGELSQRLQVKLLRVLQDRTFERVGGESTMTVDFRLIAATNRNLEQRVRDGKFREDLFYRLNVIPLRVPPLRDRREDIPVLIDHFVRKFAHLTKKPVRFVDDEAMGRLVERGWPGNVRQLENSIEYAFARAHDDVLTSDLFPPDEHRPGPNVASPRPRETEAHIILGALERQRWHHGKAAEELGISRTTLWRRMRRLGIETSPQT